MADEEALAVVDNIPLCCCGEMSAVHLLRVHRTTQTRLDLELALVVYIGWYNRRRPRRALPTRTYAERRTQGGLSKMEIIRCLKRYLAREVYRTLRADLQDLHGA